MSDEQPKWNGIVPVGMQDHPDFFVPPYDKTVELQPNYFCRARNVKREKYCRARSGQGTDHLGQGRCRNHGGCVPIKHGRYSSVIRNSIGEHLDNLELETPEEQLDIMPEARLLRGITTDTAERWQTFIDGICEWNSIEEAEAAELKKRPRFISVPELKDLATLAKNTAEIVNMIHKQNAQNAIKLADFYRLMAAMAESVNTQIDRSLQRYVSAAVVDQNVIDQLKENIQKDWRSVKLKA